MSNPSESKDIEKLLKRIFWGKVFFSFDKETYIVRSLSTKEQNYIDYVYDQELDNVLHGEFALMSEKELRDRYSECGLWTRHDDESIGKMREELFKIESEKDGIKVNAKTKLYLNKLDRRIKIINKVLEGLLIQRFNLFQDTAESRADEEAKRHMTFYILENVDEKNITDNFATFSQQVSLELINNVINKYYSSCFLDTKTVRWVARHPIWRYKWRVGKNNIAGLFGDTIGNLTFDQNNLIYWSQAYDSVFESMDRPPQYVIDNDSLLDGWFKEQSRKYEKDAADKHWNVKPIPQGKVGTSELFLMANNDDEAAVINNLNDVGAEIKLNKEKNKLKKADGKMVTEAELRKEDLIMQSRQASSRKGR